MYEQKWAAAAELYEAKNRKEQKEKSDQFGENMARTIIDQEAEKRKRYQAHVAVGIHELERFLRSRSWFVARTLLAASKRHIIIAEENEGGGITTVYFLDGAGLQRSVEATQTAGLILRSPDEIPKPRISPANVGEVVGLAIRQGAKGGEIVGRIVSELDRIADAVLPGSTVRV